MKSTTRVTSTPGPAKRGRGRPRGPTLPPGALRDQRMHLRLSADEVAALEAAAAGGEVSTWVREEALRGAARLARRSRS